MNKKDQIKMYIQFIILLACIGYTFYSLAKKAGDGIIWIYDHLDVIQAHIKRYIKRIASVTKKILQPKSDEVVITTRTISDDEVPADILKYAVVITTRTISDDEVPADILKYAEEDQKAVGVPECATKDLENMIRDCGNAVSFSDMK